MTNIYSLIDPALQPVPGLPARVPLVLVSEYLMTIAVMMAAIAMMSVK